MKNVLFEGKTEYADYIKLTYVISDGEFTMSQYEFDKADKSELFKQQDFEITHSFTINKWFTKKLLGLITEEKIKEKYGNEDGFIDFQEFCEKNKIEIESGLSIYNE